MIDWSSVFRPGPSYSGPHLIGQGTLHDHRPLGVANLLCPDMLDTIAPIRTKEVETKAVVVLVDRFDKAGAKYGPLFGIEKALEHRILHPPAVALADLGHIAEATGTVIILCHVVAHEYHHGYFQTKAG